jgi:hypothetical protein
VKISAKAEKRREGRLEQLWQRREENENEVEGRASKKEKKINKNACGWFLIYYCFLFCFSQKNLRKQESWLLPITINMCCTL